MAFLVQLGQQPALADAGRAEHGEQLGGSIDHGSLERLAEHAELRGPDDRAALRRLLEQLERLQVANARAAGWSWQEIAAELGVSRQAVHKKHAARRGLLRRD